MESFNEQDANLVDYRQGTNQEGRGKSQKFIKNQVMDRRSYMRWIATISVLVLVSLLAIYLGVSLYLAKPCEQSSNKVNEAAITEVNSNKQTGETAKPISQSLQTQIQSQFSANPLPIQHQQKGKGPDNQKAAQVQSIPMIFQDVKQIQDEFASSRSQSPLNLWQMTKQQKISLLSRMKPEQNISQLNYTPFLHDKDEQTQDFFQDYENRSEVVDWDSINIDEEEDKRVILRLTTEINSRTNKLNDLISKTRLKFQNKNGYMGEYNKGITYTQFFRTLQLKKLTGTKAIPTTDDSINSLQSDERKHYEAKYHVSKYNELPMCIIMPTYNNKPNLRYIWSLESIIEQQYSNYRVIIIDDNSKDGTVNYTASYLKWRKADPQKFILISGKEHRTALENIYYGVHKYCDFNEIFLIIDGDDELFGRQAFKVINAVYQKEKYYVLYSQFISYNPKVRRDILDIGISQEFPSFIKKSNTYRTFKHSYSQLRSTITDLILLERMSSLKLKNDKFFEILYDNALFYPAFEMACQKINYLPEIFYWYNINTGTNDWKNAKTAFYRQNRFGIQLQKPYKCIEDELSKVK